MDIERIRPLVIEWVKENWLAKYRGEPGSSKVYIPGKDGYFESPPALFIEIRRRSAKSYGEIIGYLEMKKLSEHILYNKWYGFYIIENGGDVLVGRENDPAIRRVLEIYRTLREPQEFL